MNAVFLKKKKEYWVKTQMFEPISLKMLQVISVNKIKRFLRVKYTSLHLCSLYNLLQLSPSQQ